MRARVLAERSQVRSPTLGGVLGFIFPSLGALYNGKWGMALLFLAMELAFDGLSFVSWGIPRLIYAIVGAHLGNKWAREANTKALDRAINQARP